MRSVMRLLVSAAVGLLLALLTTVALADAPPALDRTRSGTIVGDWAGAFDYYILKHPGAGRPVTLRMVFTPWHPNNERGIGFNLYAEQGRLAGQGTRVEGRPTELAITLTADFPTEYLVQVHNYYQGFRISYTLTPEGLAKAIAEVGPPAKGGTAQQPSLLVDLAQGSVPGLRHGSFDFYEFRHPGGKPIWIKMIYQPNHWIIAHGVGFNVYRRADLVARGQPLGLDQHIRWVKLEPKEPTTYLIQVYNYIPEIVLTYRLAVTEQAVGP